MSEAPSLPGHALLSPPISINPEPAYIAICAASQLVSSELELDGVTVSAAALAQLNSFLDNILFNILLAAKSTKLSLLRPAIYNVLKPKLGRAALSGADEELREYLGDDDDEEEDESVETTPDQETKRDFDLELAWKLARLRCMVYSRLGDFEEDDEDEYIERENLDERGGRPRRFSSHPSRIATATAIFLTSVVEFLAEQALAHAAQATQRRLSRSLASQGTLDLSASFLTPPDRVIVSDADMRHLGRDSPLQKLWRGWRHQLRTPTDPASRPISPDLVMLPEHSRQPSSNASDDMAASELPPQPSVAETFSENNPASIPLPMTDNDINEIEFPGLYSVDDNQNTADVNGRSRDDTPKRPRSWQPLPAETTPPMSISSDGKKIWETEAITRPEMLHRRSRSLPTSPIINPAKSNSIVIPNSDAAGSLMEGDQARDIEAGHHSAHSILQRSMEGQPETVPPVAAEMPGSFPHLQTPKETEVAPERDAYLPKEDEVLARATGVPSIRQSLDHKGSPRSPRTLSIEDPPALLPTLPLGSHPPRMSSKALGEFAPHYRQDPSAQLGSFGSSSKTAPGQSGALALAPLQEVTEGVREVPEESFPITPITEAQKRQGQVIFPPETRESQSRTSSKSSHHTHRSSSSSKLLGFDREQQSAMQAASDRAGVQRVYPVPGVPELNGSASRPSTSQSTKDRRPATASSHKSSSKQVSLARASFDTPVSNGRAQRQSVDQEESKQSLENLIRSEETLKYTLTPQSVRAMETPESPRQKTQTQDLADFFRNTAPPGDAISTQKAAKPRSPVEAMNGLRANPPESIALPPTPSTSVDLPRPSRVEQQMPTSPTQRSVRGQHQARDPKVEKSSTGDLADFAKSTGPEDPRQFPKVVLSMSGQPRRAKSYAPRFEARDPVVKGASSDLIDFIREGPPRAKGDGTHRIPRTVAPFRTTMDSDELHALGPSQDLAGRNSGSSNQEGSTLTRSTINSRTGLMDATNRRAFDPANSSNLGAAQVSKRTTAEPTQPKRKQKRVRDPYAIDMESDDEIDDGLGKPPKYEEESLIDFLRNTSPTQESQFQPQPLLLSTNQVATQAQNLPKKSTNGGFRERLKRTTSTNSLSRNGGAKSSRTSSDRPNVSLRSGNQPRPSSPHLVQSGSRFDSYKPTQPTYAAHVERNRQKAGAQGLDDGRDEGSLSRFFSRKRRVAA